MQFIFDQTIQKVLVGDDPMQPNQIPYNRKNTSINYESDADKTDFTFQWATHVPFKPYETWKLYYANSIIKNNSKYFTNCLIYLKDKSQQEQVKLSIQRETKLLVKCCSLNELLNRGDQWTKANIFIVSFDGNVTDDYQIPRCFDLVFFMSIPKQEDYEKLVRKQIKRQTKSKCGLVINYCCTPADKRIVAQFVEKTKVKTSTHQQLIKQIQNLSHYFKLEDISFEKKNSQKREQDIIKSPEVQDKVQLQSVKSINSKKNLNWATYLIVSTEQKHKAEITNNYIKYCSKFSCCIVYTKTEVRANSIFQKLPLQIKKQASILLGFPQNYMEYLRKLEEKQLRILIIVTINQDVQRQSSQFFVPNSVNLIISDNMPTRQTFKRRFGKIKQTNEGGVIVSFVSSSNENEEFRNYCKQNEIKVNDQDRKDVYDLDKYLRPSSETLQEKLKKTTSPGKNDIVLSKNTGIVHQRYSNKQSQSSIKTQQNKFSLTKQISFKSSIGDFSLQTFKVDLNKQQQQLEVYQLSDQNENAKNNPSDIEKKQKVSSNRNNFQGEYRAQIQNKKSVSSVELDEKTLIGLNSYNGASVKLDQLDNKLGKQTKDIEQLLKSQNQNNNTIIKVQNRQILNYIDAEKKRIAKNESTLQELKTKKQATATHQKNRIAQFERKLNDEEKFSRDAELYKKLKQLEKKYQQSMAEIVTLRTYKVNLVKSSEELDRLRLELSQARKIEAKFNAYKKRYGVQTAPYDLLVKNYTEKQKQCDQLTHQIAAYKLQLEELGSIREELNAAKQSVYSFIQAKAQKKQQQGASFNRIPRQGATNNIFMKSMRQNSKIPKQAQSMNLPTLIKTYLLAQTRNLSDLKPYLSNLFKGFPSKQGDSLLTESKQAKACMMSFENALKTIDKQSGSAQLINSILRLIGQYDALKEYQINISKYNRELQVTLKTLNDKTIQAVRKGSQVSPTKILDYNFRDSVINADLEEICKNVNRLLTNFNSKTAQLAKANQLIEEFKKQNNAQSAIMIGLNGDRNTLAAQLKQTKAQVEKLQTQLAQTQNNLSNMTNNYKKSIADLGQTKTKLSQTQANLKKVTKTLQQKINQFKITLKQNTEQLSITKAALQQKQRQASAQKQQLAINDTDLSKIRRALQDQKARAEERADEADKNIQDLRKTITEATKNYKDLEQKSKRHIEDERKKYQQQLQKKENEISDLKLENENQRAELLRQMKQFEELLNKSLKATLGYESKVTINNYKVELPNLSRAMMQRQSRSKFLAESSTYRHMNEEDRLFVFESIKRVVNRKIDYTKTLFEGYSGVNFDQWLLKIYSRPNLLVLVTLSNDHVIGGFSENAFSKDKVTKGKGYMMSITNKRIYNIKTRHEGKVAKYDDFMFVFGNNELLIKNNLTYTAIFARQFCYFETGDDKLNDFLGQEQEEGTFKSVEFHQVIFS